MRKFVTGVLLVSILLASAVFVTACGSDKTAKTAREAVPTVVLHSFVERKIFNRRLQVADDPNTVLWCTAFPLDAKPYTTPIAGKLVSGSKRPDSPVYYDGNGYSYDRADPQGMYGPSVPYRYGFTPGGVYVDFTDVATDCRTEAITYQQTTIGLVAVANPSLTAAGQKAHAILKEDSKDVAVREQARKDAQALLDSAIRSNKQ